jgi:hypothetical protein
MEQYETPPFSIHINQMRVLNKKKSTNELTSLSEEEIPRLESKRESQV